MKDMNLYELVENGFNSPKVLVLGDCMLDVYLDGECSRLAPDVGVPVLDVKSVRHCLGGAGNVITNLHQMGAHVSVVTVLGDDSNGALIADELRQKGIDTRGILYCKKCQTLTKTRLRREQQCLLRYDIGQKYSFDESLLEHYLAVVKQAFQSADIIFIADYDKGNISNELIQLLYQEQLLHPKIIAVDSKDYQKYRCLHPNLIKPNYEEARHMLGQQADADRIRQGMAWSKQLADLANVHWLALTLDKDGVILFKRNDSPTHYPVPGLKEGNFSGAGDTFLTALCLAYFNGLDQDCAIDLSIKAAHIGIAKNGTASCSCQELAQKLCEPARRIITDLNDLERLCDQLRKEHRLVFTNGCFDIFHAGHAHYLGQAKAAGDILIVGINTDHSINRLKGPSRPVNTLLDRIEVLCALEAVDYVVPFGDADSDNPISLLERVRPHVFVKGEAYRDEDIPEKDLLQSLGTELIYIDHVYQQSTSKIIQRVQENRQVLKKIS